MIRQKKKGMCGMLATLTSDFLHEFVRILDGFLLWRS